MTQVVNTDFDGDKKFKVALWTGIGYCLQDFEVYAFNEEHALECVLAFAKRQGVEVCIPQKNKLTKTLQKKKGTSYIYTSTLRWPIKRHSLHTSSLKIL